MNSSEKAVWQFDHLSLLSRADDKGLLKLANILGFTQGERPPFPFPGRWFYQEENAVLHVVDVEQQQAVALNHIAFRSSVSVKKLLATLEANGFDYQLTRVPEEGVVQVFITLGDLMVELDVPDAGLADQVPVMQSANQLTH